MFNNNIIKYCNIKLLFSLLALFFVSIVLFFIFKAKYNDNTKKPNSTYKYLMYVCGGIGGVCMILVGVYSMKNLVNKDCRKAQHQWRIGEI